MKLLQNRVLATNIFVVIFAVAALFTAQSAHAATKTWQGAADANMATASNWVDNSAPQSGDTLVFPHGSVANNDLATDVAIAGISISGTSENYPALEINGSAALNLRGVIGGVVSNNIVFNTPVNITDDITFDTGDAYFIFRKPLSGAGAFTVSGGLVSLAADNSSFSGSMEVSGQYNNLHVAHPNGLGSVSPGTVISNMASITFSTVDDNMTINEPLSFVAPYNPSSILRTSQCDGYECSPVDRTITLNGVITLGSSANASINANTVVTNPINGGGSLKKVAGSNAELTVAGEQTEQLTETVIIEGEVSCPAWVSAGYIYIIKKDCRAQEYLEKTTVQNNGFLKGVGSLNAVTVEDGGTIAPGNSPGTLSTGNLEFEKGGIYEFEIAGDEAGQYDQINVTGTVKLGDGTLKAVLLNNFSPGQGKSYTIINNDGTDTVEGTFLGLAEGATVNVGDKGYFTISYKGGDGNDVVLTTLPGVGDAGDETSTNQTSYAIAGIAILSGGTYYAVKKRHHMVKR